MKKVASLVRLVPEEVGGVAVIALDCLAKGYVRGDECIESYVAPSVITVEGGGGA